MLAHRFQSCSVPFVVQSSTMSAHLLPKATTLTSWAITSIRFLFAQTISRWLLFCWPTHSFRPLNSYLLFRFFLHPQRIETHSNSETKIFFLSCSFESYLCVCVWARRPFQTSVCELMKCSISWSWTVWERIRMTNETRNIFYRLPKNQYGKKVRAKITIFRWTFPSPTDTAWCMAEKKIRAQINDNRSVIALIDPFMIARLDLCRSHFNYLFIRHKCGPFGGVSIELTIMKRLCWVATAALDETSVFFFQMSINSQWP